jgi:protein-S-isoprenylcysteine O-methyltransferase Ste14
MRAAAVTVSILWFLVAFALRIAVQRRLTGDSGVRAHAGPIGSLAWWARVTFVAAVVLVAVGPLTAAGNGHPGPVNVIGLAVALAGIAATFVAQLRMGTSWRIGVDPGEQTDLVTTGMFAAVRNPIFTTMALTAVGLTAMVPTAIGGAGLALTVVAVELQVRAVEEPYLRATHGPAYRRYEARVGRFVPAIGRSRRP